MRHQERISRLKRMGEDLLEAMPLSTRSHKLFAPTPRIAPIGGMSIEVKQTLQLQQQLCANGGIDNCGRK